MSHVRHMDRARIPTLKIRDAFEKIRALIGHDLSRRPGAFDRLLQLRLDRCPIGFFHRRQGHELPIGQLRGTLPEGNLRQRAA